MQLVIVESPAKAKTIEKYLGSDYRVLASYGHVRDLPAKDGSVNPDEGFAMEWENYADKTKQLKAIADLSKTADRLILATDPDREGEAISWHVQEVLKGRKALLEWHKESKSGNLKVLLAGNTTLVTHSATHTSKGRSESSIVAGLPPPRFWCTR